MRPTTRIESASLVSTHPAADGTQAPGEWGKGGGGRGAQHTLAGYTVLNDGWLDCQMTFGTATAV
jgi:hypothetical protein